jgi:RHS repeat protein
MRPPGGGSLGNQSYTYDGLSRLESITDGKGQSTIYGYDALDRKTYVLHEDGSVESSYFGATTPVTTTGGCGRWPSTPRTAHSPGTPFTGVTTSVGPRMCRLRKVTRTSPTTRPRT